MRTKFLAILVTLIAITLTFGCGSNNNDFVVTGNNNNNIGPAGTVVLQFATARADIRAQFAPLGTTDVRVSGFDSGNVQRFGPQTFPIANTIRIPNVPVTVVRMDGEFLTNGTVNGRFSEAVTVVENQDTVIRNPEVLPAIAGNINQFASGSYFVVAGTLDQDLSDEFARESNISASIELDGTGGIAAGPASAVQHDGTVPGAHLGGTYTLNTDGSLDAQISSLFGDIIIEGGIEGGASQGNPAGFAIATVSMDNGDTLGTGFIVRRTSGLTNASLTGPRDLSGFLTSVGTTASAYSGTLVFDGAGNITGGTLNDEILNENFQVPVGDFNVAGGSTYTVADNGDFTATVEYGTFTLNLSGVVGEDGQIVFTAVIPTDASGIGRLDPPAPQVLTRGSIRAQEIPTGKQKMNFVRTGRNKCTGTVIVSQSSTGLGEVEFNSDGDFQGTSSVLGMDPAAISGDLTDDTNFDRSIQFLGRELRIDSIMRAENGTTVVKATGIEPGESPSRQIEFNYIFHFFDCSPEPGGVVTPSPSPSPTSTPIDDCPDLTSEFAGNRTDDFGSSVTSQFHQSGTSPVQITGFRLASADNPTANLGAIQSCSASLLFASNFSTFASFDTISTNGGQCEWSGNTIIPPDVIAFLDLFQTGPGDIQSDGQPLVFEVLGTKNGVPNQKIGTVTTTVVGP